MTHKVHDKVYIFIWLRVGYMSQMKAIKTFRDLLAFLTIIPLGKTDDFVVTSAEALFLFPVIGGFIGMLAAAYFAGCSFLIANILALVNPLIQLPTEFLLKLLPAIMTLSFTLVLTGLQHFDGVVDMGNAIGAGSIKERRAAAQVWTVTYRGALLAIFVEFLAFLGLFFINAANAFGVIIAAEVAAKLGMVTIAWLGKSTHSGLGSLFVEAAKRKRTVAAYFLAALIAYPLLGLTSAWVILASLLLGALMSVVAQKTFGGVPGDAIGATNEVTRSTVLLFMAWVLMS
ncbi:MAG: adenosylcobinamide-GDP ribazoletransferase [Candidatus Bathyarchaeota archaeon]|nr:adenosylcobinamide-GDP ribazoletransferase [Candidatus Bathyarchaeota archaeon]